MMLGQDTDAAARATAQATARATAYELAWRERELARWVLIFTTAVGTAAAFAVGWYAWVAHRGAA
jgi:hypothetical protein